jgi:hypothetical protein
VSNKKAYLITTGKLPNSRALRWPYHLAKKLREQKKDSIITIPGQKTANLKFKGIKVQQISVPFNESNSYFFLISIPYLLFISYLNN